MVAREVEGVSHLVGDVVAREVEGVRHLVGTYIVGDESLPPQESVTVYP